MADHDPLQHSHHGQDKFSPTCPRCAIETLSEHVKNSGVDVAIVMHRPDETFPEEDIPEGWVLVKTEFVAGKRVRTFDIPPAKPTWKVGDWAWTRSGELLSVVSDDSCDAGKLHWHHVNSFDVSEWSGSWDHLDTHSETAKRVNAFTCGHGCTDPDDCPHWLD